MAVSAVVAAVSTAGLAFTTGFATVSAAATYFLVTTAMGAALNALTPKPNFGASGGYSLQGVSGAALDHQIIYGETRVGGVRVYDVATGNKNKKLNRIIAFAGHEIDSYQEIYLNDEVITLSGASVTVPERYDGKVTIAQYLGTDIQTADTGLITETAGLPLNEGRWTSAHRLQGIAYLYTKFVYNASAFPNGVPAVSAVVRGKKVYDPRDTNQDVDDETTWVWSNNPALCLRDYLTSEYGLNQPADRIDDSLVIAAANICDQTVEGEKRYTCNGAFTTNDEPATVATNIVSSMGGLLWYGQGKWRMKAAAWTAPTVSFTEDDLRSSISLSTRHSRRDNFNSVKGTFRGPLSDWQPADYPEVTDPAFLEADNNLANVLDFPLAFTSSDLTAQRIARIALNRNREQLTFSASFGMRAFQVQVGDFININNERFGFVNKPFEVTEWNFGLTEGLDIQVRMTLREISEGVFTGAVGSTFEQNNTTLPDPFTGLEVNNLTASGGGRTQGDGTFINSVILDWDNISNAFLDYYEVEWKALSDSVYNATTTKQSDIELTPLVDGIEYTFRVRAVSASGIKGPYATVQFTGGGDVTAPSPPTFGDGDGAFGGFEYITIRWTNPADKDLNFVEIYEADTDNSAAAVKIGISGGNEFVRTNLGISVTKYYFLKAVDYSGNASAFTTGVSATTTFIDDDAFANGIYSLFTEQGLYAIEDVTSLPPSGDFVGQKVFNRTDGKLYQWTGSAWELVVAAVEAPDISGQLQTAQIAVDAVTNALIANNAVQSENIANLAVTAAKVADNAITVSKIVDDAVTTAKIADGAATSAKIATSAITETKIASDAITTPKIAAGAVTAGEISAGAIVAGKIAADAVTAGTIAAGAVTAGTIAAEAVTATEIAADSITSAKIAAGAVTATEIAAGSIIADKIGVGAVTAVKIASDSITSDKIVSGTIQALDIAAGTITGDRISGNTITGDRIVANTITGGLLATSGIITNSAQINDALITSAKIENAAITNAQIADAAITNAKIDNLSADKINAGTLNVARLPGIGVAGATAVSSFFNTSGTINITVSFSGVTVGSSMIAVLTGRFGQSQPSSKITIVPTGAGVTLAHTQSTGGFVDENGAAITPYSHAVSATATSTSGSLGFTLSGSTSGNMYYAVSVSLLTFKA